MKCCWVNGLQQNAIEIENRGLAYGDGIFTTAKILHGHIQYLTAHIERLVFGCQTLGISAPSTQQLTEQLSNIGKNYSLAVLKVVIIAGKGGRGYARSPANAYDLIVMVHDYPNHYDALAKQGIHLGISQQQLGINPMLSGLKHLNRLEQVLLRQELATTHYDDLLVANVFDEVIEVTSANVFVFLAGKLFTPDVSLSGVNGIMRQTILSYFPQAEIKKLTIDDMQQAQAMFICNCVMGVVPVNQFNEQPLATALVRPVQNTLMQALHGES